MGCEILTPAMCCGDTCVFSLRGRLRARRGRAAEPWPLTSWSSEPMALAGRSGLCFAFFGADTVVPLSPATSHFLSESSEK